MSRPDLHRPFLDKAGWSGSEVSPLADDASFRSYHRISGPKGRAVLMDAPPSHENVRPFMAVSGYLKGRGLTVPCVIAADKAQGLLLLDDLGDDTYNRVFARSLTTEPQMYEAAVDVLLELHQESAPTTMAIDAAESLSIPHYDPGRMTAAAHLFTEWYLPLVEGGDADQMGVGDATVTAEFAALHAPHLETVTRAPEVLVLRDYHADNLMWLPEKKGLARVGLLDFQDALRGHAAYDLVSLLRDARRDVSPQLEADMIQRYIDGNPGTVSNAEDFRAAYAILGAQRNAKIIGIFTRLCIRDGKHGYLAMIPRVWGLLERSLEHPLLAELRAWYEARVPQAVRRVPPSLSSKEGHGRD